MISVGPTPAFNPLVEALFWDDFTSAATLSDTNFSDGTSGTGATVGFSAGEGNHPGVRIYSTGTTTTGYARSVRRTDGILLGGGQLRYIAIIRLPVLSTASDEYVFRVGLGDSTAGTAAIDGVYFEYDRATSGDYWRVVTASNGSRTSTALDGTGGNTTSAVAAATWYRLEAVVSPDGSSVTFYVNGTAVKTHSTNIPTGAGRETGIYFSILKSAGTTARTAEIDLWYHRIRFTTGR